MNEYNTIHSKINRIIVVQGYPSTGRFYYAGCTPAAGLAKIRDFPEVKQYIRISLGEEEMTAGN